MITFNCTCLRCGKKFYRSPAQIKRGSYKYCSLECRDSGGRVKCICKVCGKEFTRSRSDVSRGHNIFCSKRCKGDFYNEKQLRFCDVCGQEIYLMPSKVCEKNYCSNKCKVLSKTTKVKHICKNCGKEFYCKLCLSNKGEGKFCTRKCMDEYCIGENTSNWRGGLSFGQYCSLFNKKFKENIRRKFNRKCFICGKLEENEKYKLSIHHVDYFKLSICKGRDWAFLPLCTSCHAKTSFNRWYYFNLLINYWLNNEEINLNINFII